VDPTTPPPHERKLYSETPNCPGCGHVLSIPVTPLFEDAHFEGLGPCTGCGEELAFRRDVLGLQVIGSDFAAELQREIGKRLAERGASGKGQPS
jgi:hypothetical protein